MISEKMRRTQTGWRWIRCKCKICGKEVAYNWKDRHMVADHTDEWRKSTDIDQFFEELLDADKVAYRMENMVNKANVYLERGHFFILIHWFKSIQVHWHKGAFDKMLTVCKYGVWFD